MVLSEPQGPCAQLVYTLAPMYLYRDDFKAKVDTIRALKVSQVTTIGRTADPTCCCKRETRSPTAVYGLGFRVPETPIPLH